MGPSQIESNVGKDQKPSPGSNNVGKGQKPAPGSNKRKSPTEALEVKGAGIVGGAVGRQTQGKKSRKSAPSALGQDGHAELGGCR